MVGDKQQSLAVPFLFFCLFFFFFISSWWYMYI